MKVGDLLPGGEREVVALIRVRALNHLLVLLRGPRDLIEEELVLGGKFVPKRSFSTYARTLLGRAPYAPDPKRP